MASRADLDQANYPEKVNGAWTHINGHALKHADKGKDLNDCEEDDESDKGNPEPAFLVEQTDYTFTEKDVSQAL